MARTIAYTYQSTYSRTLTFVGAGSTADFTRDTHTSTRSFTAYYAGPASTRISSYPGTADPREERYVGNYTRDFTGNFIGNYSRYFAGNYSRNYAGDYVASYTGNYSRDFSGTYSRTFVGDFAAGYTGNYTREYLGNYTGTYTRSYLGNFIGNYTRDFLGNYTGTYSSDYIGNYIADYTRNYTRTSTYTRTLSGGSGAGPTYVASGSDAEYGLVVYGPDGVTEIINPQTRVANLAFNGAKYVVGGSSGTLTIKDVGDPTKVLLSVEQKLPLVTFSTSGDTLTINNGYSYGIVVSVTAIRLR